MIMRPYQKATVDCVLKEWEDNQSTLVVLPTGCGKTRVASELIRRMQPKQALFLAHREELIFQARTQVQQATGLSCEIEMANLRASTNLFTRSPVVVSTIQTQVAGQNGGRMTRFKPEDFGLIIIDEAHHSTAASYRKILDHYKQNPKIKILGITATPDRADEEALGQIFDTVAYDYEIQDAIEDGWLVPIEQQMISVGSLDYSGIRTTAGDLNGADLAAVMEDEKNLQGMVAPTIEIVGEKKTLVFTSSVRHAEKCCEIFNRHRTGMATWVCGETEKGERRISMKDYIDGKIQVLVNVGVACEGFDCPSVEVVVMGRPTKSRSLYAQCLGRGTRSLTGTLDGLDSAYERKEAIEVSAKPSLLVLDFVGNSGRHKLVSAADILGGKHSDEAVAEAHAKIKKGEAKRVDQALEEAEEEIRARVEEARRAEAARKVKLLANVQYRKRTIDPFNAFDIKPVKEKGWDKGKHLSEKQRKLVSKLGVDPDTLSYASAKALLNEQFRRWKESLCTMKQANILKRFGYETHDLRMKDASKILDSLAKNGWKRAA